MAAAVASSLVACARTHGRGVDAGALDAAVVDAPVVDAPVVDAAAVDAASPVDGGLESLRVELPCRGAHTGDSCRASRATSSRTLDGDVGTTFDVTLRVRGVAEPVIFTGGMSDGPFYANGTPQPEGYGTFVLTVSEPAASYALNAGVSGPRYCFALDYERTIRVAGGATLTLTGDARDGAEIINRDASSRPIVIDAVPPAPTAFDGQFVQVDVLAVRRP